MKYVKLNTQSDMAREVAGVQMEAARRRCGGSEGTLVLTMPNQDGVYYAAFENSAHAAEFVRFCQARHVNYELLDELPNVKTVRSGQTRLPLEELVRLPPGGSAA